MQTVRPSDFEETPLQFTDEEVCLSKAFQREPDIQQLGFNLLLDRSGKLLMKKKGVYKKDIVMNPRALAAVMKSSPGRRRYSAHVIAHGILRWYSNTKQLPRGISANSASVRDWALRSGAALRKLATKMKELCRRTGHSHDKGIAELKQEVLPFLPPKKRANSKTRNPDADGSDSESSEFEDSADELESSLSSRVELESLKTLSTLETPAHKRKRSTLQTPSPPKSDSMTRLQSLIARTKSAAEKPNAGNDRISQVVAKLRESKVEPGNKFALPSAVLDSLKSVASHPAPFLPKKQYKNDDEDDIDDAECEAEAKAKVKAPGSKKAKGRKPKGAKKGKAKPSDKGESNLIYQPGEYKKMRADFIKAKTEALGVKPREAGRMWNESEERAALMSTLSRTEQVRRRFLPPLNPRGKRAKKAT